uniref:Uncharacterized protein n=1 Tax=Glossina austeni TaxID=7395 RepID=A0A1A9UZN5_GLOAU
MSPRCAKLSHMRINTRIRIDKKQALTSGSPGRGQSLTTPATPLLPQQGHAYGLPPVLTFSALGFSWDHSHYEITRKTVSGYQGGVDVLRAVQCITCSTTVQYYSITCIAKHAAINLNLSIVLIVSKTELTVQTRCYDVFIMVINHVIALINMILKRIIKYFACLRPHCVCISYVI